jgi:membrane protein implicated in regulation of membrane protease activity
MEWWAWVIGGAILLGAELSFVNAQFYLVFIGGAAIAVGLLAVIAGPLTGAAQWVVFALLAVVSMVAFRSRVYRRLYHPSAVLAAGVPEEVLTLAQALPPGGSCQAEHGGSYWTVRNDGDEAIAPGARARIVRRDGLTLTVRAAHEAH